MTNTEFKISITKDADGNDPDLDNISIYAAESLLVFIQSFKEFAKSYENQSDFRISIKKGSITSSLIAPSQSENFVKDIQDLLKGESKDNEKIKLLKGIQDRIKLNGLEYSVKLESINENIDLTDQFKGKNFSYTREKRQPKTDLIFLSGELFETGGKTKVNFHITRHEEEFKVECSKEEACMINKNLYEKIYFSAKRTTERGIKSYTFIDSYVNNEQFERYRDFYFSVITNNSIQRFDIVFEKFSSLMNTQRTESIVKHMKLFKNEFTERGILRTILMTLKSKIKTPNYVPVLSIYNEMAVILRAGSENNKI